MDHIDHPGRAIGGKRFSHQLGREVKDVTVRSGGGTDTSIVHHRVEMRIGCPEGSGQGRCRLDHSFCHAREGLRRRIALGEAGRHRRLDSGSPGAAARIKSRIAPRRHEASSGLITGSNPVLGSL